MNAICTYDKVGSMCFPVFERDGTFFCILQE